MANRLLLYELALFRRSFADGFGRWRDKLLLLIVATLALSWLWETLENAAGPALPSDAAWLGALAGPAGFAWQRLVATRLGWLAEHSAVAPAALDRRIRAGYFAAAHLAGALVLLIGGASLAVATSRVGAVALLAASAYVAGAALAGRLPLRARIADRGDQAAPAPSSSRTAHHGRRAVFRAILRRPTLSGAHPERAAILIAAATFTLTAAAAWFSRGQPDAVRVAAITLPSLASVLAFSRIDAELIGFLPYAGHGPLFVALAICALPAGGFAASALAVVTVHPPLWLPIVGILFLLHLAIILLLVVRAWLYPGRGGRSADLQAQLEFTALVLIAFMLPPLAPVALGWRMWLLRRRYLRAMWVQL